MLDQLFTASQPLNEDAVSEVLQGFSTHYAEGAWGRVEEFIVRLAAQQGSNEPTIINPWMSLFAADYGFYNDERSEVPAEHAAQTVMAICQQKSYLNVLCKNQNISLEVIDVGLRDALPSSNGLIEAKVASATADSFQQVAMTQAQLFAAMQVGIDAVERAHKAGANVFIGVDLAVANEIAALAIAAVLSGKPASQLIFSTETFVSRSDKRLAGEIDEMIALNKTELTSPLKIMQYLGGFDMAALAAAYIRCAQLGISIIVDGFVGSVALWLADMVSRNDQLVACDSTDTLMQLGKYSVPETMFCLCGTCPRLVDWSFFAQQSAHPAHAEVLDILAAEPIVSWQIKQSQGMASLMVLPVLKQACEVHSFHLQNGLLV